LKFKYKVALSLLFAAMAPLAGVSYVGFDLITKTANSSALSTISIAGNMQEMAVSNHFNQQIAFLEAMALDPEVLTALTDLTMIANSSLLGATSDSSYKSLDTSKLNLAYDELFSRTIGAVQADRDRWTSSVDDVTIQLQKAFITENPNPPGKKQLIDSPSLPLPYGDRHAAHHPFFKNMFEELGLYDIFLIEPKDARIVYTVAKELDFGTSMKNGPFSTSEFGKSIVKMIDDRGEHSPVFVDFVPYEPSANAPAAFILLAIGKGDNFKGILAVQVGLEFAQEIMESVSDGGYKTMESLMVDSNGKLRSIPTLSKGYEFNQKISGEVMDRALSDVEGVVSGQSHTGKDVVASYSKVFLPNTEWTIITAVDRDEIMSDVDGLKENGKIALIVLVTTIFAIGILTAKLLLRPIVRLGKDLKEATDTAIETLNVSMGFASKSAADMADMATETNSQAQSAQIDASQTSENMQSIAAALDEMTASVREVTETVGKTSDLMKNAGRSTVEAEGQLNELERLAGSIGKMVNLIRDVSDRTNLLALNAAVEAAHAGSAGAGFAVVAKEIRNLAAQTNDSISVIDAEVAAVLKAVQKNNTSIRDISSAVSEVSTMVDELTVSASEQGRVTIDTAERTTEASSRVSKVSENIDAVDVETKKTAELATALLKRLQELSASAEQVTSAVKLMTERVDKL
jgi:methyl-accepting chemotaxis protein